MDEQSQEVRVERPDQDLYAPDETLKWQLRLENVAATKKFTEVLDTAIEICLRDRTLYEVALKAVEKTEEQTSSPELELIEKLGVWSMRANIDVAEYSQTFYERPLDDLPAPLMIDLLKQPSEVPLSPDRKVQNTIEAFGLAIVREAFTCLGTDAPEKAEEFASADADRQYQILLWLYERIAKIREHKTGPEPSDEAQMQRLMDDAGIRLVPAEPINEEAVSSEPIVVGFRNSTMDESQEVADALVEETENPAPDDVTDENEYFYHPVRLSPKMIGVYPDITANPTCLGVSILAASFFEKAGADYIHAGVMHTALESTRMAQLHSIFEAIHIAEKNEYALNDTVETVLEGIENAIEKMRRNDRGHHAISIVKLADGRWVNFDPNYNSLDKLNQYDSEKVDKAFDDLRSFDHLDRGNVQLLRLMEGSYADVYFGLINDIEGKTADQVATDLDEIMHAEDVEDELKMYLISRIADLPNVDLMVDMQTTFTTGDKEKYIDLNIGAVIHKYILAGMTPLAMRERYWKDAAFRQRRVEDVAMAPYMLILKFLSEFAGLQKAGLHAPAAMLETGLPAYRIGACVLSDFSIYVGNEVPLSFWAANWSSHVAVEGHLPAKNDDAPQAQLARRMSSIVRSGMLRHFTSYGIIHRFLEQGENKTDGN